MKASLEHIDLIVFDVDGVLLDTSRSFPLAITRAVDHYGQLLGITGWEEPGLDRVDAFKTISGFNNDWDLAEGLLVYSLGEALLKRPVDLPGFLRTVQAAGGGLSGVEAWLDALEPAETGKLRMFYHSSVIRQLAMEHYAGTRYTELLYGFEPKYGIRRGTCHNEAVLVDVSLLERLPLRKGIYTGRNAQELQVALDLIGFDGWAPECTVCDDGSSPVKPDPRPLKQMLDATGADAVLYAGDSGDDQGTIRNFHEQYPDTPAAFVQVGETALGDQVRRVDSVNQIVRQLLEIHSVPNGR